MVHIDKLKSVLRKLVKDRFALKFKDKKTLQEILPNMKFTIKDR